MTKTKNVLIIDDDADFVRAISGLLASAGYAVGSASNGRDGLDLAKKLLPDLILRLRFLELQRCFRFLNLRSGALLGVSVKRLIGAQFLGLNNGH